MRVLHESDDSLQYLKFEPECQSDQGPQIPVTEVTKHFSTVECMFYLAKMQQMLETIKQTRLYQLRGAQGQISINTFFGLDRDQVIASSVRTEWSNTPLSDEEARSYERYIAAMKASSEKAMNDSPTTTTDM